LNPARFRIEHRYDRDVGDHQKKKKEASGDQRNDPHKLNCCFQLQTDAQSASPLAKKLPGGRGIISCRIIEDKGTEDSHLGLAFL